MAIPDPKSFVTGAVDRVKSGVLDSVSETGLGSALRSTNLVPGAEAIPGNFTSASWDDDSETKDWRVSLSLPQGDTYARPDASSPDPLAPLRETNNRMVFPYTPQVFITYQANYDNLHPTHSNYPFPIYKNSAIDQFVITGDFTVENSQEGLYWVAATHYLRTITKMSYGENSPARGAPPPVVKLNGYGDFVFNDVPVVVLQWNVELGDSVDYIKVPVGNNGSWAPARSTIAVTVQPSYSRDSVNKFNLKTFAEGGYLNDGPRFI